MIAINFVDAYIVWEACQKYVLIANAADFSRETFACHNKNKNDYI